MQIIWFRRDLRLEDNEIVKEATVEGKEVLPCFIIDPWFYQQPEIAAVRVKFLFESLENLDANLKKLGSKLYLFEGNSIDILESLTRSLLAEGKRPKLYFNRDVQVEYGINRDRHIKEFYQQHNLETYIGLNHFLQHQECYENLWRDYHNYQNLPLHSAPESINTSSLNFNLPQLTLKELWEKYYPDQETYNKFPGGENQAKNTLNSFLHNRYQGYHWKMSRPWMAMMGATSHLSPHLDFGTISARTVYQETTKTLTQLPASSKDRFSLKTFLDRLRWHDKFNQRHYFHPELAYKNRYWEFDQWYCWDKLEGEKLALFQAWCVGKTGFPMVDASMRQLNSMGWMNFRMRAMCVTFLCINCGVSWHHGAEYFMSRLVDGDIAINHWQWQAQAGVTNPMSKTFRIYNPTKNLQEHDPYLQFVYHWIPELKGYSMKEILSEQYAATSYPKPILDLKQTRKLNGKIVADLRSKVRDRLEQENTEEYQQAIGAKETIEKYRAAKDKQYQQMKSSEPT
ncbi:DNA photolyase, FAD-binding protein [Chondrocystis sp. NIES-4102]|nr:DNA photolyase, FAD-binding protein [Chondrocystis sp. NIES-4102]